MKEFKLSNNNSNKNHYEYYPLCERMSEHFRVLLVSLT